MARLSLVVVPTLRMGISMEFAKNTDTARPCEHRRRHFRKPSGTLKNLVRKNRVLTQSWRLAWETSVWVRWLALKLTAVSLALFFGRGDGVERRIIDLGNKLFRQAFTTRMFQDYSAYVEENPAELKPYLEMLPCESWVTGRTILDIGAGLGSWSAELKEKGGQEVVALEHQHCKTRFSSRRYGKMISAVTASTQAIPFKDKTFDTVFSHTVFEHLQDVLGALCEAQRVLKDDGHVLLGYNYFHHRKGDHLYPYIHFPWPTWIVSEKSLCKYWSENLSRDQAQGGMLYFPKGCRIESLDQGSEQHLNKLNFDEFEAMVSVSGLFIHKRVPGEAIGQSFPCLLEIPKLKFFLAGTIFYVLRKDPSPHSRAKSLCT
jgi:SAM-dependent methyltransferase